MSRKALGRGLSALLGEEKDKTGEDEYLELDLDLIKPNADQPRKNFPEVNLDELAQSIKINGVVQPIVVRRKGKSYQIVAGERRWRAAQRAGLERIPSIVREVSDEKVLELALIENIQRQELNAIEEAKAYKKLIDKIGLTQEMVAERVGKSRVFVANYLRLLKLPKFILALVEENKLSVGHARTLLMLEDKKSQKELANNIMALSLSVRETEKAVKRLLQGKNEKPKKEKVSAKKDANIKSAENKLRRKYGTQVKINLASGKANGNIEFEYYGEEDLDRLYNLLITK